LLEVRDERKQGYPRQFDKFGARCTLKLVGKKTAGRLLDGRTHDEYPRGYE
jgi:protein gp37